MFVLADPLITNAQSSGNEPLDRDILKILIAVFCFGISMIFVLKIFKLFLNYQIKNKALELRVSEELASAILNDKSETEGQDSIKWFFVFACLGIGFTIVHYTLPIGYHSLAIIAFSVAAAFLGYFSYIHFFKK